MQATGLQIHTDSYSLILWFQAAWDLEVLALQVTALRFFMGNYPSCSQGQWFLKCAPGRAASASPPGNLEIQS